jgi:hypothetical protein
MATLIEFYVPARHQPKPSKWTPAELRGKLIEFPALVSSKTA